MVQCTILIFEENIVLYRRTFEGFGGPRGTVKECGGLFAILGDFGVL